MSGFRALKEERTATYSTVKRSLNTNAPAATTSARHITHHTAILKKDSEALRPPQGSMGCKGYGFSIEERRHQDEQEPCIGDTNAWDEMRTTENLQRFVREDSQKVIYPGLPIELPRIELRITEGSQITLTFTLAAEDMELVRDDWQVAYSDFQELGTVLKYTVKATSSP